MIKLEDMTKADKRFRDMLLKLHTVNRMMYDLNMQISKLRKKHAKLEALRQKQSAAVIKYWSRKHDIPQLPVLSRVLQR